MSRNLRLEASLRPTGCHTTSEIMDLTGATRRQLDHWARSGYITPSANPGRGSGQIRWWTDADLHRLHAVIARITWGMTVEAAFRTQDPPLPAPPATVEEPYAATTRDA